jgi:predicted RNase H-like HicB family nuclease
MEKHYYGVFQKTETMYVVSIPDIKGCHTQGHTMEEAIEMAEDALAAILEVSGEKDIKASDFETINKKYGGDGIHIVNVQVRRDLMFEYSDKVKRNISFSMSTLDKIDSMAKKMGVNRSVFIDRAAIGFINTIQVQ